MPTARSAAASRTPASCSRHSRCTHAWNAIRGLSRRAASTAVPRGWRSSAGHFRQSGPCCSASAQNVAKSRRSGSSGGGGSGSERRHSSSSAASLAAQTAS